MATPHAQVIEVSLKQITRQAMRLTVNHDPYQLMPQISARLGNLSRSSALSAGENIEPISFSHLSLTEKGLQVPSTVGNEMLNYTLLALSREFQKRQAPIDEDQVKWALQMDSNLKRLDLAVRQRQVSLLLASGHIKAAITAVNHTLPSPFKNL